MFEIVLQNTKRKQYYSMMVFIVLLSIAVFFLSFYYSADRATRMAAMMGAVLTLAALLIDVWARKRGVDNTRLRNSPMGLASLTWLFIGNYWAFALSVLLYFLFTTAQRRLAVVVDKKFILYPSFPPKRIEWNELNNIVLKDGLLTIDFKNDKLLQSEIIESSKEINEQEFNDFCRAHLK